MSPYDDRDRRDPQDDALDAELSRLLAEIARSIDPSTDDGLASKEDDDALLQHAASIEQLVDRLIARACVADRADLDAIVNRCATALVHEAKMPIAVRQSLSGKLPKIACDAEQVTHAVRRALELCVGNTGEGGEVQLRTRRSDDVAILEARSNGCGSHVTERALTLRAFVRGCGGSCKVETDDAHGVTLTLRFPLAEVRGATPDTRRAS